MPTSYTSLLGLALPTTGELSGTWGTTVNDAITSLLDSAVAGTTTLSTDADVTLTTTDGAANQARSAVLLCSGARTAIRTLTAPAKSKGYVIINATTGGYDVKIVGVGPTTGVLVPAGTRVFVVWNGSDFVKVASSTVAAATDITGVLPTANGGTNLSSFTTNGAMYATSTSALTTGTLPVASGGTGLATLTANNVLLGNGTAAVQVVAPGTAGNVLTSTGSTWSSSPAVSGVANFIRSTKTGAYTLLTGDKGYWIDCTSGTFTLSFTAAATLTNGWWCRISNSGTGNITLDPNASETIDGLTSYVMYPGEIRDVFCDGTGFNTVLVKPFRIFLTASSTTLTMPPGYSELGFDLQGGGAGGGGGGSSASTVYGGVGGGGGGRHVGAITAPASNTSITVAVGSGGTGGTGRAAGTGQQSTAGTSGGASTITWSSVVQASADGGYGLATSAGSGLSGANYGGGLVTGDYFYGVSDQPATGWAGAWGTGREANAEYGGGCGLGMSVFVGDSGSSVMGGPAGGGGGSTTSNNGRAGGKKGNFSVGGGGAGGAGGVSGTNGGTATDGGGGGGGFGNGGTPGNGGAGTGYGSGGGGGGASQNTGFAGGNGGAGAAGYACVWGVA